MLHIKTLTNLRTLGWSLCLWLRANRLIGQFHGTWYNHDPDEVDDENEIKNKSGDEKSDRNRRKSFMRDERSQ